MEPSEEPGDDQQKLGLGSHSSGEDADEAQYEKKLSEEFEGLILGESKLGRERLVDREEGFEEKDEREGFDEEDVGEGSNGGDNNNNNWGYNGDNSNLGEYKPDRERLADREEVFDEEDVREGFDDGNNNNWGYSDNNSYLGENKLGRERLVDREEGFDEEDVGEGFNGGNNYKNNNWGYNGNTNYPVRPDAEDCQYYMRNGSCKYGSSCKFNHPLKRRNQYPKAPKDKEDYSERPGKVECKFHVTPGGCKYGTACKFNHSRGKITANPAIEFNSLGLPIRPGETECSFYIRNGSCKYGLSCRFNHPESTKVGFDSPSGYVNGGNVLLHASPQKNISSWSSHDNAVNGSGSVSPVIYSPTNRVPASNREWNRYQAPAYPAPERRLPNPPAFAPNNNYNNEANFYDKPQMMVDDFPERPGEPECSYFIKTGDCKYRSGCKFHHPKNRIPIQAACALSDKGLPLRPDQEVCSYYTRYGICKYGPACRYDHPVNYNNNNNNSAPSPRSGKEAARW